MAASHTKAFTFDGNRIMTQADGKTITVTSANTEPKFLQKLFLGTKKWMQETMHATNAPHTRGDKIVGELNNEIRAGDLDSLEPLLQEAITSTGKAHGAHAGAGSHGGEEEKVGD